MYFSMKLFAPYSTLSLRLCVAVIAVFVLNIAGKGAVQSHLELQAGRVFGGEYWRLATHPFIFQDGFFLAMFVLALGLFGAAIEALWKPARVAAAFAAITLAQGGIWLLMPFAGQAPPLAGAESLTFFVLSSAFWLYPHRFITFGGRYGIHTQATIFVLMMVSLGAVGYTALAGDHASFLHSSFQSTIGVAAGLAATFFWQRYNAPRRKTESKPAGIAGGIVEDPEYHLATAARTRLQRSYASAEMPVGEDYADEDRLNAILDVIFERGYDSLLPEEKRFLDRYSRNMR